jgi:hypothetical protein
VDGFVSYKDGALKIVSEELYEITDTAEIPAFVAKDKRRANRFGGWGNKNGQSGGNSAGNGNGASSGATSNPNNVPVYNVGPKTLKISIPADWGKEHLVELKNILLDHPGESSVVLLITNGETKEVKIKNKVSIDPVLLHKTKELVGRDKVQSN